MKRKATDLNEHLDALLKHDDEAREIYESWDLPIRLSKALADRRNELGLTQKELAAKLGVPQQDVSKVENLSGGIPKIQTLHRVASALNLELNFSLKEPVCLPGTTASIRSDIFGTFTQPERWLAIKSTGRYQSKVRAKTSVRMVAA